MESERAARIGAVLVDFVGVRRPSLPESCSIAFTVPHPTSIRMGMLCNLQLLPHSALLCCRGEPCWRSPFRVRHLLAALPWAQGVRENGKIHSTYVG